MRQYMRSDINTRVKCQFLMISLWTPMTSPKPQADTAKIVSNAHTISMGVFSNGFASTRDKSTRNHTNVQKTNENHQWS